MNEGRDRRRTSLATLHLTAALLAGVALFPSLVTLPAVQTVALRALVAAAALAAFVAVGRIPLGVARRDRPCVALVGCLMTGHWVLFFRSVDLTGVAVGLVCLFTFPVIVAFLEPLLARERIRPLDLCLAALVVVGVWLLVPRLSLDDPYSVGVLMGLASGLLNAARIVLHRQFLPRYPGSTMMLYQICVVGILLSPSLIAGVDLGVDRRWLWVLLLGVVFTALPHTLLARGLSSLRATTVSLVISLQPVYGVVLGALVLSEIPSLSTVAGGTLVVLAAAVASVRASAR